MRIRSPPSTVLLLLLPALVSSAALEPKAQDGVLVAKAPVAGAVKDYTAITTSSSRAPTQKPVVGTKDAPVDGLDGKPHAGPFVDITPEDKKKPVAVAEDLVKPLPTSLSKLKGADAKKFDAIPEKNDGVMDDVNRLAPKEGTTGTEGGVTERNKKDKAVQGQTGEKAEKKPETPKEAPPLPHSEQERMDKDSSEKVKDAINPVGKPKGAQGLEVRYGPNRALHARLTRHDRNPPTCPISLTRSQPLRPKKPQIWTQKRRTLWHTQQRWKPLDPQDH